MTTTEQKIAKAQQLREEGLTLREIAGCLGLSSPSRAWAYVNYERARAANLARNEQKRQWEREQRASCEDCGAALGPGSSLPSKRRRFCVTCWRCREAERIDERARQIVGWWTCGFTMKEIADDLGWSIGHLAQEMDRLRAKGYELPYRYSKGQRAGRKYPELIA